MKQALALLNWNNKIKEIICIISSQVTKAESVMLFLPCGATRSKRRSSSLRKIKWCWRWNMTLDNQFILLSRGLLFSCEECVCVCVCVPSLFLSVVFSGWQVESSHDPIRTLFALNRHSSCLGFKLTDTAETIPVRLLLPSHAFFS